MRILPSEINLKRFIDLYTVLFNDFFDNIQHHVSLMCIIFVQLEIRNFSSVPMIKTGLKVEPSVSGVINEISTIHRC